MVRWCFATCVLLALLLQARLSVAQGQAPALGFMLRDAYFINPEMLPRLQLCVFTGQPNVTWTYNSEQLSTSAESGGVYYLPGNGTLVFDRAGSSDNGVYVCTGTNSVGNTSATTELFFTRTTVPWYISWYMWFVYSIIVWGLSIPIFIALFFVRRKQASESLPPPDGWIGT